MVIQVDGFIWTVYVNPLCTLHYNPISIPRTLTKMRKKYGARFENLFLVAGYIAFIFGLHQLMHNTFEITIQTLNKDF